MNSLINDGERIDEIGFGTLRLIQKPEDFCYGIDAVLLATFAQIKGNARVADLGTGTGIIPIILSHKTNAEKIFGIEVQEDSYRRGLRNLTLNGLENQISLIHGDVKRIIDEGLAIPGSFDAVVTNPPYVKGNGGLRNKNSAKMIARHETTASLSDFIKTAGLLLKDRGDFYMVHRPSRLVDICCLCRDHKLEPKQLRLVSPNQNTKPNILLIHCVKNGRPELKFLDPLYVYDENGNYTTEVRKLYEREIETD